MKRKLRKFLLLTIIAGAIVIAGYIVFLSVKSAKQMLFPIPMPVTHTPQEYGIAEYQEVQFQTPDGLTLSAWYVSPAANNNTVIILAHGYAHNRQMLLSEAGFLTEHGYGVLLFDFRGHGESDSAMITIGDTEQLDVQAAVDFVAGQENVQHIGAIGFSMGAAALAGVAAEDERIEAVVLEATFSSLKEEVLYRAKFFGPLSQIPVYLTVKNAGVDYENVSPINQLCKISPRPVFLIFGETDDLVKNDTAENMKATACNPYEFWVVDGAGHQNYALAADEIYENRILTFFEKIR
jgi:uncharacterized protein